MKKISAIVRAGKKGFTLIEIMVVVVIIGILATLIGTAVIGRIDEANIVKAKSDISTLQSALQLYKMDNGDYPTTEQGLEALVSEPKGERPCLTGKPEAISKEEKFPQIRGELHTIIFLPAFTTMIMISGQTARMHRLIRKTIFKTGILIRIVDAKTHQRVYSHRDFRSAPDYRFDRDDDIPETWRQALGYRV